MVCCGLTCGSHDPHKKAVEEEEAKEEVKAETQEEVKEETQIEA